MKRSPAAKSMCIRSIALAAALSSALTFAGSPGAQAAARPSLTIGVIAPIDGGLTSFGRGIRNSVMLAVKLALKRKDIPGWDIKVRAIDDSSDPAKGEAAAKTLAADKSVVAVIGPYNSGVALLAAPVLNKANLVLISPSNTLTSLTVGDDPAHPKRQWKTYFRMVGPDSQQAKFLATEAKKLGYTTAAVVSETKAVSQGLADEFADAFKAEGGKVTVQKTVPDAATAPDFAEFLAAAAPTKPQVIFFGGEYNVAATLRTAATTAGLTIPLMGGDGMFDPAFISGAGASAAGSYASSVGLAFDQDSAILAFTSLYRTEGFADPASDYGVYAYDATKAVISVLEKPLTGKTKLPPGIRRTVVRELQGSRRIGLTGKVGWDDYGDTNEPRFTLYRVEGTPPEWEIVF